MSSAESPSRRRKPSLPMLAAAVLVCGCALAAQARADEPAAPAAAPAPEPPKIDVGGYVDAYYGYNFNEADPLLRSFDVQHNTVLAERRPS